MTTVFLVILIFGVLLLIGLQVYHTTRSNPSSDEIISRQERIESRLESIKDDTAHLRMQHDEEDDDGTLIWKFRRGMKTSFDAMVNKIDELLNEIRSRG